MRESVYASLKLGLYEPIKVMIGADKDSGFFKKFIAGSAAGAIGSVAGNPFDVLKTRMMANEGGKQSMLNIANQINSNLGVTGFYKGLQANIMRACVLNGTKMAVYDICKGFIKSNSNIKDGVSLQFTSAFVAGFFMTLTVSPFDIIRTRLMNQPIEAPIYSGFGNCAITMFKNEGIKSFYKGFVPIWGRFAPTACLQLVFFEKLRGFIGLKAI